MKGKDSVSWPLKEYAFLKDGSWMKSKYSTTLSLTIKHYSRKKQDETQPKTDRKQLQFAIQSSRAELLEYHHIYSLSNLPKVQSKRKNQSFIMTRLGCRFMLWHKKSNWQFTVSVFSIEEAVQVSHILEEFMALASPVEVSQIQTRPFAVETKSKNNKQCCTATETQTMEDFSGLNEEIFLEKAEVGNRGSVFHSGVTDHNQDEPYRKDDPEVVLMMNAINNWRKSRMLLEFIGHAHFLTLLGLLPPPR